MNFKPVACCVGLFAAMGGAHIIMPNDVHFHSPDAYVGQTPKDLDFGRLPQAEMLPGSNNEPWRLGSTSHDYAFPFPDKLSREEQAARTFLTARKLEGQGRFRAALRLYQSVDQPYRLLSFVRDREEVFRAMHWRRSPQLMAYLEATFALNCRPTLAEWRYESIGTPPVFHSDTLTRLLSNPRLGPHAAYARGDFRRVIERWPRSPRAPAALLMLARESLEPLSQEAPRPGNPTTRPLAPLEVAEGYLRRLLARGNTPYRSAALGLLGRCAYLRGDVKGATALYFKQIRAAGYPSQVASGYRSLGFLARINREYDREILFRLREPESAAGFHLREQIWGLDRAFSRLTASQATKVQKRLRQDARLLAAYITYRVENTRMTKAQQRNLLDFASSSVDGGTRLPSDLLVRLAQLQYNNGKYRDSLCLAGRATTAGSLTGQRAQYIRASSLWRLGRSTSAIRAYESLLASAPPFFLAHSAREQLAIVQERVGDFAGALKNYYRLRTNQLDVAFLCDVSASPSQVRGFVLTLPRSERGVYWYALGMRYLRIGQYRAARGAFLAVPKKDRLRFGMGASDLRDVSRTAIKSPGDPLHTTHKLAALDARIGRTSGQAHAQALYDKGAYLYAHRNLLFYSFGLWRGVRSEAYSYAFDDTPFNTKSDFRKADVAMWEHECVSQALRCFRRIPVKHPKSSLVPSALYSSALCAQRLGDFNGWWRDHYGAELRRKAVVWLNRVHQRYPLHPLATAARKYATEFAEDPGSDF